VARSLAVPRNQILYFASKLEEVEDRDKFVTAHDYQSVGYAADALGVIARYETAPR
jgi:hypothetical protein